MLDSVISLYMYLYMYIERIEREQRGNSSCWSGRQGPLCSSLL